MYQVYIKTSASYDGKKLLGEFSDYEKACEKVEAELEKNKDIKYVIEESDGSVNSYGDLITWVVDEN